MAASRRAWARRWGAVPLRSRQRPAADRLVHGLRHAARRQFAELRARRSSRCCRRPIRSASGRRRRRHDAGARRDRQRDRRCLVGARRHATSRCRRRRTPSGAPSRMRAPVRRKPRRTEKIKTPIGRNRVSAHSIELIAFPARTTCRSTSRRKGCSKRRRIDQDDDDAELGVSGGEPAVGKFQIAGTAFDNVVAYLEGQGRCR